MLEKSLRYLILSITRRRPESLLELLILLVEVREKKMNGSWSFNPPLPTHINGTITESSDNLKTTSMSTPSSPTQAFTKGKNPVVKYLLKRRNRILQLQEDSGPIIGRYKHLYAKFYCRVISAKKRSKDIKIKLLIYKVCYNWKGESNWQELNGQEFNLVQHQVTDDLLHEQVYKMVYQYFGQQQLEIEFIYQRMDDIDKLSFI